MANLSIGFKRKVFTIDDDENRTIALNTSDVGIISRWSAVEKWFEEQANRFDEDTDNDTLSEAAIKIEAEMREKLNYIFDADVCGPICGNASLLSCVDGQPIYLLIMETLIPLYEENIMREAEKSRARIAKHTGKYVGKK